MRRHTASVERSSALRSQCFELGEDLLDRVQVWRLGRLEQEPGAGRADSASHGVALVARRDCP